MANKYNGYKEQIDWHAKPVQECLETLQSTPDGLDEEDVRAKRKVFGNNALPAVKKPNELMRFLKQFHNILIYVLLGSACITVALQHYIDTAVILAVVLINAFIGFIQEGKAEKAMDTIRQFMAPNATVIRCGIRTTLSGEDLVPGDIVILEAGNKVPADLRLINAHGLILQESILTGESVPVEKSVNVVSDVTTLGDRSCMAYSGTMVTNGQGKGVVTAIASETEIGRVSGLLAKVEPLTTPLVTKMRRFAKWISLFILVMAFILFSYGYFLKHYAFGKLFMLVISLCVAAIPEGLPAVLTITLAIGMQSMVRRNAIIRRLPAIEAIGSVSVICTDKTGTLTKNEMMVVAVTTIQHTFDITGEDYSSDGEVKLNDQILNNLCPTLIEIARTAMLCNDSELKKIDEHWVVEGDPMEAALLSFASKAGLRTEEEHRSWKCTDRIPFDAAHCLMATLYHNHTNQAYIFVKGAPEKILPRCQQQKTESGQLEDLALGYWQESVQSMASKGQRILAFALKPINAQQTTINFTDIEQGLIFLGVVGLMDPPRPEACAAISQCYKAGIEVKMFTGDHAETAAAIGRKIGIQSPNKVLTGADLEQMDDACLAKALLNTNIFARTTPEQKLKLIRLLQSYGKIVAMTGDGVNDAPAIKQADIGIAMGKKGSDVAIESSDLILVDDNFSSIVAAIREGRTVYDNLKKVISWTLPTNAGEILIIISALFFGLSLPITPIQILWINLITASTLGIALAFEPTEENTMLRYPRLRDEPLLSPVLAWHSILVSVLITCIVFGLYFYAVKRGYSVELARTISFNAVVVLEIFHLFFIRNIYGTSLTRKAIKGNKAVWLAISIISFAQLILTYMPLTQEIFHTKSIPILDGALIIGMGLVFFIIIEIEKQIRLKLKVS